MLPARGVGSRPIFTRVAKHSWDARRKRRSRPLTNTRTRHWQSVRSMKTIAWMISRLSVVHGRSPALAGGINGSLIFHSASVRSLDRSPLHDGLPLHCMGSFHHFWDSPLSSHALLAFAHGLSDQSASIAPTLCELFCIPARKNVAPLHADWYQISPDFVLSMIVHTKRSRAIEDFATYDILCSSFDWL